MDHVIAKVKRLRKDPYKKLLSDVTLYSHVDLRSVSLVNYNPDHNLDDDAWFKIESFSKQDFFLDVLSKPIDTKDLDDLKKEKFPEIVGLLGLQGEDVYFQKVTSSSFIKRKIIAFGEIAAIEESVKRIIVKETPDAVFIRNKDLLLFKDIASVSSIFPGIDQLYKEATDEQVQQFFDSDIGKREFPRTFCCCILSCIRCPPNQVDTKTWKHMIINCW